MKKIISLLTLFIAMSLHFSAAHGDSFLDALLGVTGISRTPSGMRGGVAQTGSGLGNVWVVDVTGKSPRQVTTDGGFYSPIFMPDGQNILVLKGEYIFRVPISGIKAEKLYAIKGIVKMVGFSEQDQDKVLLLRKENNDSPTVVGFLSLLSGQVTNLDYNDQIDAHKKMLTHLEEWARYYGNTSVDVRNEGNLPPLRTNVYLNQPGQTRVNLSQCDRTTNCGQPSFSHDGHQVVFIKEGVVE